MLGAVFLMATSAIGPGFITQTTQFTTQLGAAFAFAILVSVLGGRRAGSSTSGEWSGCPACAPRSWGNRVAPGLGHALALIVAFGGLVFNVGNVAGAGLGLDALLGLDPRWAGRSLRWLRWASSCRAARAWRWIVWSSRSVRDDRHDRLRRVRIAPTARAGAGATLSCPRQ